MSAVWVVGAMWMALSLGLPLLLAGGIRLADARETGSRTGRNFAVDGDPFAVPLPAPPAFVAGGGPSAPRIPGARRPLGRG